MSDAALHPPVAPHRGAVADARVYPLFSVIVLQPRHSSRTPHPSRAPPKASGSTDAIAADAAAPRVMQAPDKHHTGSPPYGARTFSTALHTDK